VGIGVGKNTTKIALKKEYFQKDFGYYPLLESLNRRMKLGDYDLILSTGFLKRI